MSAPGSTSALRTANQRRIVDVVRAQGQLSQAEIARRTELAPATVSNIVKQLGIAGVLEQINGSGRRGATVRIARHAGLVAGVDFDHSHVHVALADMAGQIIGRSTRALSPDHNYMFALTTCRDMLIQLIEQQSDESQRLRAIGIGLPAPIPTEGLIDAGSILPGWVGINAAQVATEVLELPCLVDNDANLGALAEATLGAGVGTSSMIYLRLASGLGAGIVIDSKVFRGGLGTAGEVGHMSVNPEGPLCRCGTKGCLEAYVGGPTLVRQLSSVVPDADFDMLVKMLRSGDKGTKLLLEDAGRYLGNAMAVVANIVGPELIVVGGDLASVDDTMLRAVQDGLRRQALQPVSKMVRVVPAALGSDSSIVGAVLLALEAVELTV